MNVEEFGEVRDKECKDYNHIRSETPSLKDQKKCIQVGLEGGDMMTDRNSVEQRLRVRTGLSE